MIHGQQLVDLKGSFRAEPAFQFPDEARELLRQKGGPGYQGEVFGLGIWSSSRVAAAGGNRHGAFWLPGGVLWARGSTNAVRTKNPDQTIRLDDMGMLIEFDGTPGSALSTIVANAWFGIAIGDDERGFGFVTDQ
jgi:hypothetical protein